MEMVKFNNASANHESRGVKVTSTLTQGKNQNVLITLNPIGLPVQGEVNFCLLKTLNLKLFFLYILSERDIHFK